MPPHENRRPADVAGVPGLRAGGLWDQCLDVIQPSVFVVDDDPDFLDAVGELLTQDELRPVLFSSARHLLAAMETARPSLIILDLMMPVTSGAQMIAALRREPRWRGIPLIILTGANDTSLPLRFDAPIVSKTDLDELRRAISSTL